MLFTSLQFVGFLCLTVLLYYLVPKKGQWILLLAASYAFYAFANWRYLFFIAVTTVTVYFAARLIDANHKKQAAYLAEHKGALSKEERSAYKDGMKKKRFALFLVFLILNVAILAVTKYTNFVINNVNAFLTAEKQIRAIDMIVPLGISFYTFQSLGYLIDVYRGKQEAQKNPVRFALFVSFFPQLVQGPISRYGDLAPTLFAEHRFEKKGFSYGLMRVLWGYFKKMVIADRIVAGVSTLVSGGEYKGVYVFAAMLFYAFQLYCDFTGGIDITIGIAEMMGIRVTENFNLPYFSKNIKEYWKRWHITMGTWFTDYIFYPISVCTPMLKLSKWSKNHLPRAIAKRLPVYLSSLVVWFVTGLWHGAAWNFIVWGLMNFAVIMISQELEPLYSKFHKKFRLKEKKPYAVFEILRTVLLMSAIRMFDCYRNVPLTFAMFGSMFTTFNQKALFDGSFLKIGLSLSDYALLLVGFAVVLTVSIFKLKWGDVRGRLYEKPYPFFLAVMAVLVVVILVFGAYGPGYNSAQFIYNQF